MICRDAPTIQQLATLDSAGRLLLYPWRGYVADQQSWDTEAHCRLLFRPGLVRVHGLDKRARVVDAVLQFCRIPARLQVRALLLESMEPF